MVNATDVQEAFPFDSSGFGSEPEKSMERKHPDKQLSRLPLLV